MDVKNIQIQQLKPYQKNAKKHDKQQVDNVAESIRRFGFVQPIVIDKDGVVIIGHCRLLAAQRLGMTEVPCICIDDLTPEQVDELRVVDNKTNESPWDMDILADILPELDLDGFEFDFGISENCFTDEELEQLMEDEVIGRAIETHRVTVDCNNTQETEIVADLLKSNGYNPKIINK